MEPKSMAIAMVEDASRVVARMNQREIAQAQAMPSKDQRQFAAKRYKTSA
ncbi:MAG: hypothetical protein ACI9DC_001149 [Gammaproteobacteria bacterium]|jgi:hypothetical protein